MLRLAVYLLALLAAPSAYAQAVICSLTPGPTTSNTVCANTAFVQGVLNAFVDGGGTSLAPIIRSYLGGLGLSNDSGTPNTVLDIAAGAAVDSTNAAIIKAGAFTKSTAGAWAAGSGSNGMGNGLTIAASTWYHVCLASNSGTPDYWFDTSVTCANRPSGITDPLYRRIGSFRTDGSSNIIAFSQNGDEFLWNTPVNDTNSLIGIAALTYTLTVPTGVKVNALIRGLIANASSHVHALISSMDVASAASNSPAGNLTVETAVAGVSDGAIFTLNVRTNTSAQIRGIASASTTTIQIVTYGWIDRRGKDN